MNDVLPTIAQALEWAVSRLRQRGIDNPRLDAEVLLANCLNADRAALYRDAGTSLAKDCQERFRNCIARRAGREPVAYITGMKEFRSASFSITPQVLIPRPETETIIDVMIQLYGRLAFKRQLLRVLEIGTGSGIIAVSLASELERIWINATDCDLSIIAVASANAALNGVSTKISFLVGDLLNPVICRNEKSAFDCIISNPPYLSDDEWNMAQPEIRTFEPERALRSGPDGLSFYRQIIPEAGRLLRNHGYLLLEMGRGQSEPVAGLIRATGLFGQVATAKDLSGTERVIMAQKQ